MQETGYHRQLPGGTAAMDKAVALWRLLCEPWCEAQRSYLYEGGLECCDRIWVHGAPHVTRHASLHMCQVSKDTVLLSAQNKLSPRWLSAGVRATQVPAGAELWTRHTGAVCGTTVC